MLECVVKTSFYSPLKKVQVVQIRNGVGKKIALKIPHSLCYV